MLKKVILFLVAVTSITCQASDPIVEYGHLSYSIENSNSSQPRAVVRGAAQDIGSSVTIPDYIIYEGKQCPVEAIDDKAFYYDRLNAVTLGSNLKWIGVDAFYSSSVSKLVLPSSLTRIYGNGLPKAKELIIEDGDQMLFFESGQNNVNTLYLGRNVSFNKYKYGAIFPGVSSLTIGERVSILSDYVFSNAKNLTFVNLPAKLEKIGVAAFRNTQITTIEIPASVTLIDECAFADTKLNLIKFNGSNDADRLRIEGGAFYNVSISDVYIDRQLDQHVTNGMGRMFDSSHASLQNVEFGPNAKTVGAMLFNDCYRIENINLPEGIVMIDSEAFEGCKSLASITLPKTLEMIGIMAFRNCTGLRDITLPENLTEIVNCAFDGCSSLRSINIPDRIEQVEFCTFRGCSSLENISFGSGIKRIEDNAFEDCSSLKTVILPEQLERLASYCFKGCSELTKVEFPASFTYFFGSEQFSGCSSLTDVVCHGLVPATTTYGTQGLPFDSQIYSTATLWVPDGCVDTYKTSKVWAPFCNISGVDTITVVDNEISIENGYIVSLSGNDFNIDVYSLAGEQIYCGKVSTSPVLPIGIYIVKSGTVKKYIVR